MQKWSSSSEIGRDLLIHYHSWQQHLAQLQLSSLFSPTSTESSTWERVDNSSVAHLLGIDGIRLNSFAKGWHAKSFILKGLRLMLIIHPLPVNMFILLGNTLIYTGTWNIATNVTRLEMNKHDLVRIAKWHSKMQDAGYGALLSNWKRPCTPFYYLGLK